MQKLKYVDARAMDWAVKATKGTGLYPRDLLLKAGSRGLFTVPAEGGGILKPRFQGLHTVAFQGLRVQKATTQAVPAFSFTPVTYDDLIIDTPGMWDPATPDRVVIPPGVNMIRLEANTLATIDTATRAELSVRKNGADFLAITDPSTVWFCASNITTGPIVVAPGDYLQVLLYLGAARTLSASPVNYLSVEILDASLPYNPFA